MKLTMQVADPNGVVVTLTTRMTWGELKRLRAQLREAPGWQQSPAFDLMRQIDHLSDSFEGVVERDAKEEAQGG